MSKQTWRIAESLETLRHQLNDAFPKRSKASDGGIGDAKHKSTSSDHNPHITLKGMGIVSARDFTHDPKTGIDCQWLADALVKNKDPRIKYIIWNRQICSSKTSPWKWRAYNGVNAHTKHLHLSVDADPKLFDSTKPWKLDFPKNSKSDIAKISAAGSTDRTNGALSDEQAAAGKSTNGDTPSSLQEQPPIIATPMAAVPALSAAATDKPPDEKPPEETALQKIGNKANAAYTAVGSTVAGVIAWFSGSPVGIVAAVMGAVALLGMTYMYLNYKRAENKADREAEDKRLEKKILLEQEFKLKIIREGHTQEAQMYSMRSVAEEGLTGVTIHNPPPVTELPNSDAAAE